MAATRGKKRVAELEAATSAATPSSKKKKTSQDENVLEKVLSLCTDKNTLTAGMVVVRSPSCCDCELVCTCRFDAVSDRSNASWKP